MTTVQPIVTPPIDAPRRPRGSRTGWVVAGFVALLLVGVVAASLVEVPYYAFAPGRPVSTTPLVSVLEGPSHEPEGDIYLTTVQLYRTTVLEAFVGWLDPTIDVVKQETILPSGTPPSQLRATNLEAMASSKQAALGVAYEALGFDAIRGTGATVMSVVPGSPVDGLVAEGDTVVAVGDQDVDLGFEVSQALEDLEPGEDVTLSVEGADGGRRDVRVVLGANPDIPGRPFLGVMLQTRGFGLDFPFDVSIDSEDIGGPSAGLAFTLEVLDRLTAGDLTGGMAVAATGEIGLDGRIGPIGGAAQKGVAVEDAGIRLFLVPRSNYEQATRETSDDLRVEPVDTLEDALRILEEAGGDPLVPLEDDQVAA